MKLLALLSKCCLAIPVTFKVDFRGRHVAPGGPHLVGSFQEWDPSATSMVDGNGDGIYVATLDLPASSHQFKFINGSSLEDTETPPACSSGQTYSRNYGYNNEDAYRQLEIAENATSAEVHLCFQECQPCDALSLCKMVDCGSDLVLKDSALNVPGETRATCCRDLLGGGWRTPVVVRSAGYSDGNRAEFWLDGELIHSTGERVVTVVEVQPALLANYLSYGWRAPVKHKETFDTYVDSSKLEAYLSTVPSGHLLLMGAVDEASAMLSPHAKAMIGTCGAKSIQQVGFRSSYALIGQKNGSALSEVALPEGSGHAVAVAEHLLPHHVYKLCKMYNCYWGIFRNVLRADAMETPGHLEEHCCERAKQGEQSLVVRSEGFSDGNRAECWLNGQLLYRTRTRGLTVVDLWPNMTVKHRETFDTSTLVAYLSSTATGNIILVGAVDEASRGFSQEAENLLRQCGATFPKPLPFRSSYALIGIKAGRALSEVVMSELSGCAVAVAEVIPSEQVRCNQYNRPAGFVLKADAMETLGASLETCCKAAGAGEQVIVVRSAGYEDGNKAEFWLNGELLYETSKRGLTIVDLWPNLAVKHKETFDTHADCTTFIAYLSSTAEGNMILIGAADEASAGITLEAANLLRECGATFPRPISWRSSYALIGIKGGNALSEVVRRMEDGKAVAVAATLPPNLQTTTTSTLDRFMPVDGGMDRACRGAGPSDNNPNYYRVVSGIESLLACKEECMGSEACVGVEHSGSRCEVWTRPEGIQASIHLARFTCLSYNAAVTTTMAATTTRATAKLFAAVDGGINRACRGASASDNDPGNYMVVAGVQQLGDCES
ncbi:Cemip [Symbiodinium pilosum]|uniref:Cemip protein n=1 Tax=Symbiodinium pilosum TaxID=2952 RepID=A0A812WX56_SYMPI|nr:Cemip [Symbiodinium pilosum]